MTDTLDHEDAMELAVSLTCSHLGRTGSSSTQVEELIAHFYQQVRNAENRLKGELAPTSDNGAKGNETEEEASEEASAEEAAV